MQDETKLQKVTSKFAVGVTRQIKSSLDKPGIAKQFLPTEEELVSKSSELHDPIGDHTYSPIKGIIHRYPDRCLLHPVKVCAVYCRFCFRRETVGKQNTSLSASELEKCYEYIRKHSEIWEVILSGGDPLVLSPVKLQKIINKLDQIEHVAIIRLHTRVPIVDSRRVNTELLEVLKQRKPIYMALHMNHPDEFTEPAIEAISKLADAGVVLIGQTVLLHGINDTAETLGKLFRKMVRHRIKPYYLHHLDRAEGTSHFRTSIEAGQKIMAELRGRYSGLCLPEYVLDIPGGAGKSPIGPCYLSKKSSVYEVTNYQGKQFTYNDSD